MNLVLKIVNIITPYVPANMTAHKGRVKIVAPIGITIGATVITPDGLGEVVSIYKNYLTETPETVSVMLYRGYRKSYNILDLKQYVIYHWLSNQFVKLTPAHYRYIYMDNQPVEYRVTTRLYAMLTEKSRENYSWIKTLNKHRHGHVLLNIVRKNNLIIKKED